MNIRRKYMYFTAQGFNVKALMGLYAVLEDEKSIDNNFTPFVVFIAFSIESYLNTLGSQYLDIWDELERLPWKSKVEILHKTVGKKASWGEEPLQFAKEVFKLRDKLAHGKTERIIAPENISDEEFKDFKPEWYKNIDRKWVIDAKEKFRILMVYLSNLFDLHESDHLRLSTGGSILLKDENA